MLDLQKTVISNQIQSLVKNNKNRDDPDKAIKEFADGLTDIIVSAIQSGTVIVPAGIPVTTAGSAVAQTGATTAPAQGSIK